MQNHYNNSIADEKTALTGVTRGDEIFYKISGADRMSPFFMSVVSDSNHWLFIASTGGISAGRKNPEYALFPYYTDDKITDSAEHTGSKTILQVLKNGDRHTWEPFSIRSEALYTLERNIYKSRFGNKIILEEINKELGISFQYEWNTSNLYGFVRKTGLVNHSSETLRIRVLDGIQNILPYGVGSDLQNSTSNLANAYKRSELLADTGLGIFALSAIIVDKAEPSEALKANVVWSSGLDDPQYLLSSSQLATFRAGDRIKQEEDVKGEQGAYFICSEVQLEPGREKNWALVANVNQSQSAVIQLSEQIKNDNRLLQKVFDDVEAGTQNLLALAAASDALQYSSDDLMNTRHFSNVLFNIMRGGIFDDNYTIEKNDFIRYLEKANRNLFVASRDWLQQLPETFTVFTLKSKANATGDRDLVRIATEYLPLKFSRRHGDPSRPWNKFTINTRSEIDGSKILDYEGNWRDIFQNWEALAHAYPAFIEGMIFKFLNASTFDGYNPYRVTKDGFDWETIEPDNPWSYIGYWGDHQLIYLLKFLEFADTHYPGLVQGLLDKEYFVYANVPYRIKAYRDLLNNPKDTIEFDHNTDTRIRKQMIATGADGALLSNPNGSTHHVNFIEKILVTLLAKITNLVPGGGIWMNTQRPEWNDANNALVGNGLSMVTLFYLRRFLHFLKSALLSNEHASVYLSAELFVCLNSTVEILEKYAAQLPGGLNQEEKKKMLDELGEAGSRYRLQVYQNGFSGSKTVCNILLVERLVNTALQFIDDAARSNKRKDGLYHTYNLLSYDNKKLEISHLSEMLEGQVAVLSSGVLSGNEAVELLDTLKNSSLYEPRQYSYILYPNKELPSFLQKNTIPDSSVMKIPLLQQLLRNNDTRIIEKDVLGNYHFNGNFKNAGDLATALQQLDIELQPMVEKDRVLLLQLFEEVFNHKAFTGRSGTFFGYEGLGSIYWHMVSKLLLAVCETVTRAVSSGEDPETVQQLEQHYHAIQEGIGVHKPPSLYGAFPTDPYSHTPFGKGARQPGMTGQVKEDIISRFGELGLVAENGKLSFRPKLLLRSEFLKSEKEILYINHKGQPVKKRLPANTLFFTYCQTPVIYSLQTGTGLQLTYRDGSIQNNETAELTAEQTSQLFSRTGTIEMITVFINGSDLSA